MKTCVLLLSVPVFSENPLIHLPQSILDDCKNQNSCEDCYKSSFMCHWCKDIPSPTSPGGTCHAKFSQYGCQVGDACSSDDCANRKTCSSCNMGGCKWCASSAVSKCVSPYSWACALPSNCIPNEDCKRDQPEFIGNQNSIPKWVLYSMIGLYIGLVVFAVVSVVWLKQLLITRRWLYRLFLGACLLGLASVGIGLTSVAYYWPSAPEVSMCNAELMWKDTINMIINTVTTGKASVESELLITVYNPNRLGGVINSISGNIYYKAASVGTVSIGEIDLVPGSASDSLGVLVFNGFDKISEIYYDFNVLHKLVLEFELFVNVYIGGTVLSTVIPKFQMNINDPPIQKHCKCDYSVSERFQFDLETL